MAVGFVTPGQFQAASQYASAQKAKEEVEKKRLEQSKRAKFKDFLKKPVGELADEEGLPPEIAGMEYEQAVTYLLDNVTMAADNFKNNPYTNAFAEYRTKISQFLKFVEKNAYEVESSVSRPTYRLPNPKKSYLIKVIDDKLEQLARDILYNQAEQMRLLAQADEINGLLVDLFS